MDEKCQECPFFDRDSICDDCQSPFRLKASVTDDVNKKDYGSNSK